MLVVESTFPEPLLYVRQFSVRKSTSFTLLSMGMLDFYPLWQQYVTKPGLGTVHSGVEVGVEGGAQDQPSSQRYSTTVSCPKDYICT